mgnify:CR=1 FL=1
MNNEIKIEQPQKVSEFIPDWLQQTITRQMEEIDAEIHKHEEVIKELNALYSKHAHFLFTYSPFEQRNLSQECSIDMIQSPEALPQAEGRDKCGEGKAQDVQTAAQFE